MVIKLDAGPVHVSIMDIKGRLYFLEQNVFIQNFTSYNTIVFDLVFQFYNLSIVMPRQKTKTSNRRKINKRTNKLKKKQTDKQNYYVPLEFSRGLNFCCHLLYSMTFRCPYIRSALLTIIHFHCIYRHSKPYSRRL